PAATDIIRSSQLSLRYQKPISPAPIATIPTMAVNKIQLTSQKLVSIINNSGCNTNIYGMINAAIASLDAFAPFLIGSPWEIPVAANAASATGGVISATMPK